MEYLLPLVMLTACAAAPKDMSGKMFTFPQKNELAHVNLTTSKKDFSSVTVCQRSFTDLDDGHTLFSLATPSFANDFLLFWRESSQELQLHIRDKRVEFKRKDYELNMWHSICSLWDATSGLSQLWFDGKPSTRKFISTAKITGDPIIILGQDQDSHGGWFHTDHSFCGMISDVHMWDYVLSPCEIQNYMDELSFTPGNVLNWKALEFQIADRVLIENKKMTCR